MEQELFDIDDVKNEFLQKTAAEYGQVFTPRQLELAMYILNDFCSNLSTNNLILLRIPEQQQVMPPQPMDPYYQQPQRPPYVQQQRPGYSIPPGVYQAPQPIPQPQNPFEEDPSYRQVQQNISEMNRQLQPPRPVDKVVKPLPIQDVDLSQEKPKSFVDGLRAMKSSKRVVDDEE